MLRLRNFSFLILSYFSRVRTLLKYMRCFILVSKSEGGSTLGGVSMEGKGLSGEVYGVVVRDGEGWDVGVDLRGG
jgi:hypothetical protein